MYVNYRYYFTLWKYDTTIVSGHENDFEKSFYRLEADCSEDEFIVKTWVTPNNITSYDIINNRCLKSSPHQLELYKNSIG